MNHVTLGGVKGLKLCEPRDASLRSAWQIRIGLADVVWRPAMPPRDSRAGVGKPGKL